MVIESGEFSPNTAPFTASWPGDTVAHREKGGLKLLYAGWAKAVDAGRWPTHVRPFTRNRRHVLKKLDG
jgi:hypothetical protein